MYSLELKIIDDVEKLIAYQKKHSKLFLKYKVFKKAWPVSVESSWTHECTCFKPGLLYIVNIIG